MSTDLVSAALGRPKVCQNCHNAHVSSKITLGDGADCEVLWVCRTCTLELQKHDDELATTAVGGSDTLEQGEFKTDDLERLFLAKTNKKINQKVADLAEHYQLLIRDEGVDGDGNKWNCVDIEFNFIEYVTGISIDQLKDCLLPENQPKNRYANVVAPDPTRVRLQPISGPTSDYINANWIPGRIPETEHRYIAAQGPLPNTVLDFWRMVYEHNVSVIMMLTQEIESERVKCEHYWPDANNPAIAFADVTVRFIQEDVTPEITTRYFDLTHSTSPDAVRRVTHFQYTEWPDFGQPSSCAAFLKLGTDCDAANHTNAPLLVHCSAGIGRTGTFIVVHTVFEEYRYYHEKQLPLTFNLIDVLVKIRAARPGLVQTKDQLQFCYRALCEAIAEYNNTHGPPAKVRAVKVQPLPPSGLPPALAKAAAAQVEIVPYDQAKKSLKKSGDIFVGDNSDDSTDTDSLDRRHRRRERARNGRPSIGSSSSGRRRKGSGHHSDGEPQRRRHGTRSSHGRRSRGDSRRHSPAASPSVLDRFAQEAKNGGTSGNTSSNDIYID